MPSFSFKPVVKSTKVKSTTATSKYTILMANIEGTVVINLQGKYQILVGDIKYDIASECYSCKGVTEIYEQVLEDNIVRTRHIRSEKDRDDRDRTMYLPFTAGCCVKGNVVRHKTANVIIFKIKKVFVDINDPIAKEAIAYYRKNYTKIRKSLFETMKDNFVVEDKQIINNDLIDDMDVHTINAMTGYD